MANNVRVNDYINASNYAEITGSGWTKGIRIRGSAYDAYSSNSFSTEGARSLARYILELADDAEKNPELDALKADLSAAYRSRYGYVLTSTVNMLAEQLHELGYVKP